jgi:hypothetical protein
MMKSRKTKGIRIGRATMVTRSVPGKKLSWIFGV